MNPSLHNFRESLLQRLLDFLWRQWSALGVAGHARSDDPWMIDPEALLLFFTHIARHDSRLFDEILDWLHTNGSWINLQRPGTLHKEERLGDSAILAAIADLLSRESAHLKWKLLMRRVESQTLRPQSWFSGSFPPSLFSRSRIRFSSSTAWSAAVLNCGA